MKRKNLLSGLSNLASTMLIRKIKKGILFTVLVSLCLCLSLSIVLFVGNHNASATTITLTNQGFEDEVESGTIPGWTQAYGTTGVSVTKESAYSLHYSFKMVDTSSTSSVGLESDKVSVVAAQDYKATVMAYVAQGGTSLYIRWYDGSSPPQLISSNYVNSTTTGQWAGVSITATAPANATQAAILLYSSAAAVTTAYFDDVAFYGVIKNAGFETGNTSGWTQAYGTGGLSVVTTNKYSGNYSLKLVDSSSTSSIGLESNKVSVVAAKDYRATVMAYVDNGTASLYIRWYDSSNAWISSNYVNSTTTGQWARMSIAAAAPANATKAAILLYSGAGAVTTAYFDDAEFDEQFINLQKQVTNTIALEGIFTKNASNEDVLYTPLGGTTTKFAEINLNNYTANKKMLLPNAAGAWAMAESSTGKIYTGTYTNGNLYSHTKGSSTVSDLGQAVAGGTNLFDVDAGPNGIVYGGVYSTSGGKIFKYDPSSGFTVLNGGNPLVAGEDYVRSVAYYASTNHLYAGIGSHAYLIKYNLATGTSTNILPSQYSSESFVYSLDIRNGKLFARLSPSSKVLVINLSDNTVDAVIEDVSSLGVSPQSPNNSNLVYYSNGEKKLCYYNMSTKTTGVLNVDLGAGIVEFGYINDGTNNILVGLGAGKVFKYNLSSSAFQLSSLDVYEAPTKLQNIKIAPDGKIYSSGYLAGGIGVYNPTTGQVQLFRGVHQSEGMTSIGDDMYFGVYPGAHIVKNVTTGLWNPVDLFNLHDNGQDRPFGMLGVASENKLFIGTVPGYGQLKGALSIYNPSTGSVSVTNVVYNQSVVSLAYKSGKVYGGTSIYGGLGINPTETEAKLFIWDVASGTRELETIPVANRAAITSLLEVDGNIWGFADGYLFVFDPVSKTVTYSSQVWNNVFSSHVWRDVFMVDGNDGYVYVTSDKANGFVKINKSTKVVTSIKPSFDGLGLTYDNYGNLYYFVGEQLWKYQK